MTDSQPASQRKVTRSRHGCDTCRARKVRCDERPGRCFNCERLGLICASSGTGASGSPGNQILPSRADASFSNGHTNGNHSAYASAAASPTATTTGLKRKRTYRSCSACRLSKTRCSGQKPACLRCREKALRCAYEDETEPAWKQRVVLPSGASSGPASPSLNDYSTETRSPSRRLDSATTPTGSLGLASPVAISANGVGEDLSWLVSPRLPEHHRTRVLVERYFANVHHLRCFAFLHKPTFLQRLDSDADKKHDSNPLLHVVCALGALFYAVEYETSRNVTLPINPLDAGKFWADRAQNIILARLDRISVENLMAAVLLHDYEIRLGNYSNAFMLSSITARMAQALQINLEHSTDVLCREAGSGPSASVKESRRRLMWCCYITDSLVGSGIDQLTLIDEADIKIQLPCNERNFTLEEPCITETLEPGQMLKFLPQELLPSYPQDSMGMTAFYLRHIATRRKVLKYIKHLDTAKLPWLPDSEFAQLDAELRDWYDNLPANLQFTPTTLYIRQETSQVGALCALHYAYHQTMCDLYRIGAPGLYRLRSAFIFPPEQSNFLAKLRFTLFGHARSLATIMSEALRHGPHAIADSWLPTVLYDSCKIMLFYLTQLIDPSLDTSKALMAETIPHVRDNVKALKIMRSMYAAAGPLSKAADTMLEKVGIEAAGQQASQVFITEDPYANTAEPDDTNDHDDTTQSQPGTPAQSAPDYILNPLSIYRLARKNIPEKHAPERHHQTTFATTSNPPQNHPESTAYHNNNLLPAQQPAPFNAASTHSVLPTLLDETMLAPELRGTGDNNSLPVQHIPQVEQINFDELQSLFTSDPTGWTWQPAETAVGSRIESSALPPWESNGLDSAQLDAWVGGFALDS
ncbi:unnamed protein product [Zymoseptoria tritici ST99CH_1A5]|uniref:Zn(2)-C6 fungal-type domain-containing protein n=1 Tax=Zymoseptoria tritici ST99CH_1A5 TaxID=1276529 RepID=A0A1Y6LWR0_ZYMTR|nr:unnamed protein product [Zymoseptoria tritici ST99CH_3D1]SMY28795.1 unnamed protein product [Zymoseptoria tritici ST99CH_1A5]